ncbi:MAG TPA: hypothetical protein VD948_07690 [Rhodothermales bacterium]|nr:hypothetical protein [Rhodothermales bacterium]
MTIRLVYRPDSLPPWSYWWGAPPWPRLWLFYLGVTFRNRMLEVGSVRDEDPWAVW